MSSSSINLLTHRKTYNWSDEEANVPVIHLKDTQWVMGNVKIPPVKL